jgi:hypothetical protein
LRKKETKILYKLKLKSHEGLVSRGFFACHSKITNPQSLKFSCAAQWARYFFKCRTLTTKIVLWRMSFDCEHVAQVKIMRKLIEINQNSSD